MGGGNQSSMQSSGDSIPNPGTFAPCLTLFSSQLKKKSIEFIKFCSVRKKKKHAKISFSMFL